MFGLSSVKKHNKQPKEIPFQMSSRMLLLIQASKFRRKFGRQLLKQKKLYNTTMLLALNFAGVSLLMYCIMNGYSSMYFPQFLNWRNVFGYSRGLMGFPFIVTVSVYQNPLSTYSSSEKMSLCNPMNLLQFVCVKEEGLCSTARHKMIH